MSRFISGDISADFLLPVVYLGARMGSEVGQGSHKAGLALGWGSPGGVFKAGREAPSDLGDLVELAKEFVEHEYQLLRGALTGQPCEAHDVSIQHAGRGGPCQWGQGLSPRCLPASRPSPYLTPWCLLT